MYKRQNLKDADFIGQSDPYVVVRVGKVGSDWGDKRGGEHEAKTAKIENEQNPTFDATLSLAYGDGSAPKKGDQLELQFGVFDQDDWNLLGDDSLGSARVVVGWDALSGGEAREYSLQGGGAGSTITLAWSRTPASA